MSVKDEDAIISSFEGVRLFPGILYRATNIGQASWCIPLDPFLNDKIFLFYGKSIRKGKDWVKVINGSKS